MLRRLLVIVGLLLHGGLSFRSPAASSRASQWVVRHMAPAAGEDADGGRGFSRGSDAAPINKNKAPKRKKNAQRPQIRVQTITTKNTHISHAPAAVVVNPYSACLCGSGAEYKACCGILHMTSPPNNTPEAVLRARYSAFASANADYIVASSHPSNPDYQKFMVEARASKRSGAERWKKEILAVQQQAGLAYLGLEVVSTELLSGGAAAEVVFRALFRSLSEGEREGGGATGAAARTGQGQEEEEEYLAVEEKATFVAVGGSWYYKDGVTDEPDEAVAAAMIRDWPALRAAEQAAAGGDAGVPQARKRRLSDPSLPSPVSQGGGKDGGLTAGSSVGKAFGNTSKRKQASGGLNDKANVLPFPSGRA